MHMKSAASKTKLAELQGIISKMPLDVCCVTVLPEFGLRWWEVSRAVRNSRLPMLPSSVARVLCRHAARSLPGDEVAEIVSKLRLKLAATQERKWHVVNLMAEGDEPLSVAQMLRALPARVAAALRTCRAGRTMRPEVDTVLFGDLLYMSVQMVSDSKQGAVLFVATPPGQPVMLVSSLCSGLLQACVTGLGYMSFEDAKLSGRDVTSLLRVNDRDCGAHAAPLALTPPYAPPPRRTRTGLDYTYRAYDKDYVDQMIGPDPPLLTDLTITSTKPFFDPSRLDKPISLTMSVRSEHVARSLKAWVAHGALAASADLLHVFHKIRSNRFQYEAADEE